jgi:hypothetical protein
VSSGIVRRHGVGVVVGPVDSLCSGVTYSCPVIVVDCCLSGFDSRFMAVVVVACRHRGDCSRASCRRRDSRCVRNELFVYLII